MLVEDDKEKNRRPILSIHDERAGDAMLGVLAGILRERFVLTTQWREHQPNP